MAEKEDEKDKDNDNGERFVRKHVQYFPEDIKKKSEIDKKKGKQKQDKSKK